jgi:hypothetical protein
MLANAYSYDVPGRDFWFRESTGFYGTSAARAARGRSMLAYTQFSLSGAQILITDESVPRQEVIAAIQGRFKGHPDLVRLRQELRDPDGSAPTREELLAAIRNEPQNWDHYRAFAEQLIQAGDYAGAAEVAASYPKFRSADNEDTVVLSNAANELASVFYWRAELEPAKKLNRIASGFKNGSSASLTAAQRLLTMERDFAGALDVAVKRCERYADQYAFRDYITLLYASGARRQAAATFDRVALNPDGPAAWDAALFGQRLAGLSDADVPAWIRTRVAHSDDPHAYRYGALFALQWGTTDRLPAAGLPDLVRDLAHDPIGHADSGGATYPSLDMPGNFAFVRGSAFRAEKRTPLPDESPVDSELTLFATAYVALRHKQFAEAVTRFDALAERFSLEMYIEGGSAPYALPYFAYASSRSGDTLGLERFIDSFPENNHGFDYYLAKAFFASARGTRDSVIDAVRKAYDRMPFTGSRPVFVDYQFIEACEWLYAADADPRLRDLMLNFARRYQVVNPFRAWPYAIVALYTADTRERENSLRMAVYLDANSVRLEKFPAPEIARARDWAKSAAPFGAVRQPSRSVRLPHERPTAAG